MFEKLNQQQEFEALIRRCVESELRKFLLPLAAIEAADRWLSIEELCTYLPDKPAIPTVYGWVHKNLIPFNKNEGRKRLRFRKSKIDTWLESGRKKTFKEIREEADNYVIKPRKKKKVKETENGL